MVSQRVVLLTDTAIFCQPRSNNLYYLVCPSSVIFEWPYCHHSGCVLEGCTVLAFVSIGHDTYSAGVLLLCAIHVPFCAVASFCLPITTLWCYSTVICARLFDTVIFSGFYFIYCLTEGSNKWLFLLLSHGWPVGASKLLVELYFCL